jgi:hypothetical protein
MTLASRVRALRVRSSAFGCRALAITALLALVVSLLTPRLALAPGAADTPPPVPDETKKAEARAHFERGIGLLREEAWTAALAEFLASRELYPTRAATNNAAIALRKLQRYDEALDMFESFLRDFPGTPPAERELAQRAVAELKDLVGVVDISGAEPGSTIVINGQPRGEYPPTAPLRVPAGTHLVRVYKEGFEPFESRADVAGGQTVRLTAKMRALTESGRLKVTERTGRSIDVVVDNITVGVAPWEGNLSVGNHTVLLRGKGRTGTQPVAAPVKSKELTTLTLVVEELDAALRVTPTPPGAMVAVDSVQLGRGAWFGWLRSGTHLVEVTAEGFLPFSKQVELAKGGRENLNVQLDRDPNAAMWRKPSRWEIDATAGLAIAPSFGGDPSKGCSGTCSLALGLGGLARFNAGYQLGSGVGFGIGLGYLDMSQSVSGRSTTLTPLNRNGVPPPQNGTLDDDLHLRAFLGGANIFYHIGDRFPVLLRLGAGALIGKIRDERQGTFTDSTHASYKTFPVADSESATYVYVEPEVRFGVRLADHWDLTAGAQLLLLIATKSPTWNGAIQVGAGADGVGNYASEALLGQFAFVVLPSVNVRYDF